jgi:adenylate kinase
MQPIIHVFGRPGSGKGTLADMLADRRGWRHLRMGAALTRWAAIGQTAEQRDLAERLAHGELAADEQVLTLVREFLDSLPELVPGVVFDGFPRTLPQLTAWESLDRPSLGVLIDAPASVCVARMQARHTCTLCGHTQADPGPCERCGERLTAVQSDRDPTVIRRRFEVYAHITEPLLDNWGAHHRPLVLVENVRHPQFMFRTILSLATRLEREAAGLPEQERRSGERISFAPGGALDVRTLQQRLGYPSEMSDVPAADQSTPAGE